MNEGGGRRGEQRDARRNQWPSRVPGMQIDHPVGLLRMVVDVRRDGPVAVEELIVLTHEAEEGLRVEIAQIIHDARRDANSCMHAIRGVELPPSVRGHRG